MNRLAVRLGLGISFLISIAVAYYAIAELGLETAETWVLIAADLAVITSIFSTWSSQRVLELEEDSRQPNIYLEFDPYSRYSLIQLRLRNSGGSAAKDIRFHFDREINRQQDGVIRFGTEDAGSLVPILNPGESAGQLIGTSIWFFQNNDDTTFKGSISYANASGRKFQEDFVISAEQYRNSLVHDTETTKAHRDIQDIPSLLRDIANAINR